MLKKQMNIVRNFSRTINLIYINENINERLKAQNKREKQTENKNHALPGSSILLLKHHIDTVFLFQFLVCTLGI